MSANEEPNAKPKAKPSAKNWDEIVRQFEKEEEEEAKRGEGSVDDLFKQIYATGSEEVRKAMNKSFQESGGTVLSTNWSEVAKSKVEVKPPDGCEHKPWDKWDIVKNANTSHHLFIQQMNAFYFHSKLNILFEFQFVLQLVAIKLI